MKRNSQIAALRRLLTVPRIVAAGVILGIFVIGAATLWQRLSNEVLGLVSSGGNSAANVKTVDVLDVNRADFDYLVPRPDDAWKFDKKTAVYDKVSRIVKYGVHLNYSEVTVTVTQQKFPDKLKPRGSANFLSFIDSENPSRTQDTGKGKAYFLATLQNGAAADGSDTVIYATDDQLMFLRSARVVGYDAWTKLIGAMQPH